MPLKYTHIMYLEYRICFLAKNIIILNEYRTIQMVCFSPINHQDKQNYDTVLRIVNASHLLDNIAEARATKCYVGLMKSVIDSYLDKSLDPLTYKN